MPEFLSERISWVNVDSKTDTNRSDAKEAITATASPADDPRVKLLDLRGKLGDSFGPLNALLSSLGFIALLYSINMQRAASTLQESIQQRQRFEELFSLTIQANREALREIGSLSWDPDHSYIPTKDEKFVYGEDYRRLKLSNRWIGKEALRRIWNDEIDSLLSEEIRALMDNTLATEIAKQFAALATYDENSPTDVQKMAVPNVELAFDQADWQMRDHVFGYLVKAYKAMYENNEFQLDAYFRTLYRIFELLSRGESDYGLQSTQVREYAAIARAQLSWHELAFTLLNCVSENFEKAGRLYNRFALFDNLTTRKSIVTALARKFVVTPKDAANNLSGIGAMSELEPAAFNTDLARKKYDPDARRQTGIA